MQEVFDMLAGHNDKWLKDNTIYLTRFGSNAYGTATPTSDLDIRGVSIPPIKEYGLGLLKNFEQAIFSEPIDLTVFGITKFVKLAMENNPSVLEILFTDESDHIYKNEDGQKLLDIKDLFLSKKARYTMGGYAYQQIKRLKLHKSWIMRGEIPKPERKDFGLPEHNKLLPPAQMLEIEGAIRKIIEDWTIDTTGMSSDNVIKFKNELHQTLLDLKINSDEMDVYAARYLGLGDNLMEQFKKERQYKSVLRDYQNWQNWKKNRNKERAASEEKLGYDGKFAIHVVRLYEQCEDLLKTGKMIVKRPNAEELLSIRNGAWTFDQLMEFADNKDKELDELYKISTLRREPERVKINEWLINLLSERI